MTLTTKAPVVAEPSPAETAGRTLAARVILDVDDAEKVYGHIDALCDRADLEDREIASAISAALRSVANFYRAVKITLSPRELHVLPVELYKEVDDMAREIIAREDMMTSVYDALKGDTTDD